MRVLVTGSEGYLGKPLLCELAKNHVVVGFDILKGNDVTNYAQVSKSMQGIETVVHTAALPKPDDSKSFEQYFNLNCVGTMNVVRAAIENKVQRIVFISSTGYYGVERGIPVKLPLSEEQQIVSMYLKADELTCKPAALMYSQSKVLGENILAFYGLTKQIQIICLRLPRIGDKDGPYATKVSMANAVQAIVKSVELKEKVWFEAFNISDELSTINISKAKKILGYVPKKE